MKKKLILSLSFLFPVLSFIILFSPQVQAQSQVEINRAQEVTGVTIKGERVRKLLGDVSLKSENMVMYCDSAYQYLDKNEVRAFGNIEIDTPNEQIYSDTLIYYTDVDFSQLRGRVIIEADSATLYSQAVDYRFSTKVGHFIEQVRLEDPEGVLTANSGFYYREPDSAVFRGNVQVADSLQYIEGDSLFINRRKNTYRLYGDIFVDDRENSVVLKGDSLKSDTLGHRNLEGNAWLKKFEPPVQEPDTTDTLAANSDTLQTKPEPADTTHIRARKIHSIQKSSPTDTTSIINAYHNVHIWSPKFAAIADTAQYTDSTETFVLRSNPTAWHKHIQLTGPYIQVELNNEEIDRLISYPTPFVVQQDTTLDRLNQVTGDTLRANFTDGDISRIHVFPNSHLLRFTKDENDEPDGAIDLTAPSIKIFFTDGQLVEMKAQGPIDGMYLPESEQTAKRQLDGFIWTPDKRPEEPQGPMKRRLPPIPEKPSFELPTRYIQNMENN